MKKLLLSVATISSVLLSGCNLWEDDAKVVSHNLSKAADNFEVLRRVVFYNGITDKYMLEVVGFCSIKEDKTQLEVTCKIDDTGDDEKDFFKHFLGRSDNVAYFVEQLAGLDVSANHYRVTFKPQAILPDIDIRGGIDDLPQNQK